TALLRLADLVRAEAIDSRTPQRHHPRPLVQDGPPRAAARANDGNHRHRDRAWLERRHTAGMVLLLGRQKAARPVSARDCGLGIDSPGFARPWRRPETCPPGPERRRPSRLP